MAEHTHENRQTEGYSAFISHASNNSEVAQNVCRSLEAAGYRCWIAPRDVRPGQEYAAEIVRGIELSKCLVLILSKEANSSDFVRAEVERAYSKGKPIFPLRIEEVLPSRSLELFISTKHWIDAWRGNISDHAAKLALELARDPDVDIDLPDELRRRVRMRRLLRVGSGVIGSAAIAILVALIMRPDSGHDDFTMAPTTTFGGGYATPNQPLQTHFFIADAHASDGPLEIFKRDMKFEVFEVRKGGPPVLMYKAKPGQFTGQYEISKHYAFKIDALPKHVVSCVVYMPSSSGPRQATMEGFNFDYEESRVVAAQASRYRHFSAKKAARPETVKVYAEADCAELVSKYAKTHLTMERAQSEQQAQPSGPGTAENAQDLLVQYKTGALQAREWFACNDGFCSFYALRNFFRGVKRVRFGESPDRLDRTIELPQALSDQQKMDSLSDRYYKFIPIRHGAESIYVQLEFFDGTTSDPRPARMEPQRFVYRIRQGVALTPMQSPDGTKAPILFAAYPSNVKDAGLEFRPDAPPETKLVKYAFDEGGFFVTEPGSQVKGSKDYFAFVGPVSTTQVRIQFSMNDGVEHGPFRYAVEGPSLVLKTLRARFAFNPLADAIECRRASSGTAPNRRHPMDRPFFNDVPSVVCVPAYKPEGTTPFAIWAAVHQIRVGTRPGNLSTVVPVKLDIAGVVAGKVPRPFERDRVWKATLPVETQGVYMQLTFRDGKTSEEIRLPIKNIQ